MRLALGDELILRGERAREGVGVIFRIKNVAQDRFSVSFHEGRYHAPLWVVFESDVRNNPLTLEGVLVVVEKASAKPYPVLGRDYVVFKPSETQTLPAEITQTPPSPESQKVAA
jgi:hypothetical protein